MTTFQMDMARKCLINNGIQLEVAEAVLHELASILNPSRGDALYKRLKYLQKK